VTAQTATAAPTVLHIYDELGVFGVTAADFVAELKQITGPIQVHISSPGGDFFDGIAIFESLRQYRGPVTVVVDSLAASAASVIAMAASPGRLIMAENSMLMIHEASAVSVGNAADMIRTALLLEKASETIAAIYAGRSGKPAAMWRQAMQAETWYTAQEAVAAGLADSILT
jgi:ATP-dependent protease ClpP protease subunit